MDISIRKKLGQIMMMDFRNWDKDANNQAIPFTKTNTLVNKIFNKYNFGGFILFKENIQDNQQVISLLRDLQANIKTPLFFAIDQEGGRVNRIKQGTSGCGNMAIAATGNPDNAYTMAKLIGSELYALGINTNFAPVIDVNCNKNNPIIGVRAYSDDPNIVIKYARKAISGFNKSKIIDCVKHFPGHGDTSMDSHHSEVILNKNLAELEATELQPFKELASNYSMVMSAHISIPALDNSIHKSISTGKDIFIPATLSHKIITKLLKEQLNFKGLVISDALDMQAIATHFGTVEAAKLAILAGIDMLLMPVRVWAEEDIYKLEKLFDHLEQEYMQNTKFAQIVDKAYDKVLTFKKDHKLDQSLIFKLSKNEHLEYANLNIASQENQDTALKIAKQSTTLVKNSGIIPLNINKIKNLLVIDSDTERLEDFYTEIQKVIQQQNINITVITRLIDDKNIKDYIEKSDIILLISANLRQYSSKYSNLTSIKPKQTINIAALTPYDNSYIDDIENYICIYGATSIDQTNYTKTTLRINIQAVVEKLLYNEKMTGKLPVNI